MTDTLTWSAPVTQSCTGGATSIFNAIATLMAADPYWEVNASDTAAAWIELKPRGGPYVNDRVLLVSNYAIAAGAMLNGAASVTSDICIVCAMNDGGTGPNVANIAAAAGPYAGFTTRYAIGYPVGNGVDSATICTSRDALVISLNEASTGDTWPMVAGRVLETPTGDDLPLVSTVGGTTVGLLATWWTWSGSGGETYLFTSDTALATTDRARTGITDGITSGINLVRVNGINGASEGCSDVAGGLAFCPIILARATTNRLAGVPRQIKMGGRRIAGIGSIQVGGVNKAHGIGANSSVAEDTLWMTQDR